MHPHAWIPTWIPQAGVAYLHDNNVVHCNLRPEHVMLLRQVNRMRYFRAIYARFLYKCEIFG
jgi:hypothetical protein